MKTSEITSQAKTIVKDVFWKLNEVDEKAKWLSALDFISTKIAILERGERGEKMFVWRKVKSIMLTKFGKKFIISQN